MKSSERSPLMKTIFGRDTEISSIITLLASRNLVTLAGAGGIGKTTVARAIVQQTTGLYEDGVVFVELAPLTDCGLLIGALATALGLSIGTAAHSKALVERILQFLRDRRLLIVLDSCENHLNAVPELVELLLGATQHLRVLTTSREPLFSQGEHVHWMLPIDLPHQNGALSSRDAMRYAAVAMFLDRAGMAQHQFDLDDTKVESIVSLCRRLDGIPLAIELAAAAVSQVGVETFVLQLDERLFAMGSATESAPERHRTLGAMLDWSYGMLSPGERQTFERLSLFRGAFSLESAVAIVADATQSQVLARDIVLTLVDKSLVSNESAYADGRFRMLDTTRAYASRKLELSGNEHVARQMHAEHVSNVMARAEDDWERMTALQWRARYVTWIDDIRAALEWAFSDEGDAKLGVKLTVNSFPIADQTALMSDVGRQLDRAMRTLGTLREPLPWYKMRLQTAIGLTYQRQEVERSDMQTVLEAAFDMARTTGSAKYQVGPLLALWSTAFQHGSYSQALGWSSRIGDVARKYGDAIAQLTFARTQAQTLHFLGRHEEALPLALQVIDSAWMRIPLGYMPSPVSMRVSSRIVVARIKWMQGLPEQALMEASACVEAADKDSPTSLCQALALAAIPIALWRGEDDACRALLARLRKHAMRFGFEYWVAWSARLEEALNVRAGARQAHFDASPAAQGANAAKLTDHLCTFTTRIPNDVTFKRALAGTVGWCASEAVRCKGELLLTERVPSNVDLKAAEAFFSEAIWIAQQQRALSWELRASTSMARLMLQDDRAATGARFLKATLERFSEGFDTADFLAATSTLHSFPPQVLP